MKNPYLKLDRTQPVGNHYKDDRYLLPLRDVQPLPVDNITAERLAEYIWGEVEREIRTHSDRQLMTLTVGIEEEPGQAAYYSNTIQ